MNHASPPDAAKHNPTPAYLRALLSAAGLLQRQAALRIGVSERMLRYYLAEGEVGRAAPYCVQYALEGLPVVAAPPPGSPIGPGDQFEIK